MANYWTLLIGIPVTLVLFFYFSPVAGITAGVMTIIIFTIRAIMNYRNTELMSKIKLKEQELNKKWKINKTEHVENGEPATAIIKRIADTGYQSENKLKIKFQLEVKPKYGQPFESDYEKYISLLQIPLFQAGKEFTIKFDPKDKSRIEFVSFALPEGKTIFFADYEMD